MIVFAAKSRRGARHQPSLIRLAQKNRFFKVHSVAFIMHACIPFHSIPPSLSICTKIRYDFLCRRQCEQDTLGKAESHKSPPSLLFTRHFASSALNCDCSHAREEKLPHARKEAPGCALPLTHCGQKLLLLSLFLSISTLAHRITFPSVLFFVPTFRPHFTI